MQNNLIRLRKEAGLSQEELADKLAVSRQAVSKWERGEALPDTDNLIRLAKLYNVSIDEIVGYTPEKGNSADNGNFNDNADDMNNASDGGNADEESEDGEYFTQDGETKKYYSKTKGGKHIRFETDGKQKRIIISDDDDMMTMMKTTMTTWTATTTRADGRGFATFWTAFTLFFALRRSSYGAQCSTVGK